MKYDVIIVLAGGIQDDGSLADSVKLRIEKAVGLLKSKFAPRIIMSGRWSRYREIHIPPRTEAAAMAEYAQSLGVSKRALLKEESSNTTEKNAFFCHKLFLKPNGWKNIIVVSSDYHLPRVRLVFSKTLGEEYSVRYVAAKTSFGLVKRIGLILSEQLYFVAHWWRSS